jgi:hypothetical protein
VIGAVSKEKGLEYYQTFEKSVNVDKFIDFIENLKKEFGS